MTPFVSSGSLLGQIVIRRPQDDMETDSDVVLSICSSLDEPGLAFCFRSKEEIGTGPIPPLKWQQILYREPTVIPVWPAHALSLTADCWTLAGELLWTLYVQKHRYRSGNGDMQEEKSGPT